MIADKPKVYKGAFVSDCGTYRYSLIRVWDDTKAAAVFIMLNPSVADADVDDPTIRRCMGFAKAWGCGSIVVFNLFAFRATSPKVLIAQAQEDRAKAVGPDNDWHIRTWMRARNDRGYLIAAWGGMAQHPALRWRKQQVMELLPLEDLQCLDITLDGSPRHPLYCRADLTPVKYEGGLT